MKTLAALSLVLAVFLVSGSSAQDDGMQHREIDGVNEVAGHQQTELESPEGNANEDGDVSQRQFYRPGSHHHFRPSYNPAPIRPGINHGPAAHRPYNRPVNVHRPPNHIYNNGHHHNSGAYRPSNIGHQSQHVPPFNNFAGPTNNQLNYGSPSVPYINFQSVGPNGRPALTYLTPNFGFFFRNKNAAGTDGAASEVEAVPVAVIDTPVDQEAADIKFGSR